MNNNLTSPMISLETLQQHPSAGGKKLLNLPARNHAITLMKCRSYLDFSTMHPKWALLADHLICQHIPKRYHVHDAQAAIHPLLQQWKPALCTGHSTLLASLKTMFKATLQHNVNFSPLAPSPDLQRSLPIWHHLSIATDCKIPNNDKCAVCHQ